MSSAALSEELERRGIRAKDSVAYVGAVKAAEVHSIPTDAEQLHAFLERLRDQVLRAA